MHAPNEERVDTRSSAKAALVVSTVLAVAFAGSRAAEAHTATLISPANESTEIPQPLTFQWSAIAGADRYYLYVRMTARSKDVVNSGETTGTSYAVSDLPRGSTLYVRLWTRLDGIWRFRDSTFSTSAAAISRNPLRAQLTSPSEGAAVATSTTFRWTAVSDVQAYYLYVGTAQGLKEVVDADEIQYGALMGESEEYLESYYINYPLLFLNLYRPFDAFAAGEGTSPLPFLTPVSAPIASVPATYVVQCAGAAVDARVDGLEITLECDGIAGLSQAVRAARLELTSPNAATAAVFRLPRLVFELDLRKAGPD